MFKIERKERLTDKVSLMEIQAPLIAKKAKAGQFIILRVNDEGERIPLTIADTSISIGTVTIIYQIVGATTMLLDEKEAGDYISDFVGPLGTPTHTEGYKNVAVIGGGVGSAIAYPIAKQLFNSGVKTHNIIGFRNKDFVILEKEFESVSTSLDILTDDGSYKKKGLVTDSLRELISREDIDCVFAIGPLIMMKFVSKLTKEFNIKTVVSMNPIMIDGTGMCGGCRLTVGGKTKFACVDGPDFDGHLVDFDEAMDRASMYREEEAHSRENCNLFKK